MKFDSSIMRWVDLGGGVLLTGLAAVSAPAAAPAWLAAGGLWLALAWRMRLSCCLIAVLWVFAARNPMVRDLEGADLYLVAFGLAPWVLSVWGNARWIAIPAGILWAVPLLLAPEIFVVTACALPRLGILNRGHERAVVWSGALALAGGMAWAMVSGRTEGLFLRPGDPDIWTAALESIRDYFRSEAVWAVIPLAGLFELAQRHGEDTRMTWRSLALLGVALGWGFVAPDRMIGGMLLIGFPVSAILLTRWTYAMPNLPARVFLWTGLALFAVPMLGGGAA